MQTDPQILALEAQAAAAKLNMAAVLRTVGVAPSTWWRWREGRAEPKLGTLRKVQSAIEDGLASTGTIEPESRQDAA